VIPIKETLLHRSIRIHLADHPPPLLRQAVRGHSRGTPNGRHVIAFGELWCAKKKAAFSRGQMVDLQSQIPSFHTILRDATAVLAAAGLRE